MNTDILNRLSPTALRALAASLRDGALSCGVTRRGVTQIVGGHGAAVHECLQALTDDGMAARHTALLLDALAQARQRPQAESVPELVLSGPDLPGIPMRTGDQAPHA